MPGVSAAEMPRLVRSRASNGNAAVSPTCCGAPVFARSGSALITIVLSYCLSFRISPGVAAVMQQGVVDRLGDRQELLAAGTGRDGEAEPLIDPGKGRGIPGLTKTEGGFAPRFRLDVDREPLMR